MLKIWHARLQPYAHQELPGVQTGFRKGGGTRDQIANIHWVIGSVQSLSQSSVQLLSRI